MRVKKTFFILIFCAALAPAALAARVPDSFLQDVTAAFRQGNAFYEKGEYAAAVGEYGRILNAGYASAAVYYDLGNAYFKSGVLGKAIVNYERALSLEPRDADMISNLSYARSSVSETFMAPKFSGPVRMTKEYAAAFSIDELTWISSALYITAILLLFLVVRSALYRVRITVLAFVVLLALAFNTAVLWQKISADGKEAVVLSSSAEALYGPFETATVFYTLREGMKVDILKYKDEWVKVLRADGKAGWVKKSDIEII